jgi:hypothetical protein
MRIWNLLSVVSLVFILLGLTACPMSNGCKLDDTEENMSTITTRVHVANAMCGTGYWGNVWLMPEGERESRVWLRPFDVSAEVISAGLKPHEGEIWEITYKKINPDSRYDKVVTCEAYPGEHTNVWIQSMKFINAKPDCSDSTGVNFVNAVFRKTDCDAGVFGTMWLEVEGRGEKQEKMLLHPFAFEGEFPKRKPLDGDKVRVHFSEVVFVREDEKVAACKLEQPYRSISIKELVW